MVNLKNKQTVYPNSVGAVSNRTGAECLINSKVYHSHYSGSLQAWKGKFDNARDFNYNVKHAKTYSRATAIHCLSTTPFCAPRRHG